MNRYACCAIIHGMQRRQPSLGRVINVTTGIILVFLFALLLEPQPEVAFGLLALSWIATIWMTLRILKDPFTTDKSFDIQFYLDRDDIRRLRTS